MDKVIIGRHVAEDEVDLDSGFVMLPSAVPSPAPVGATATPSTSNDNPPRIDAGAGASAAAITEPSGTPTAAKTGQTIEIAFTVTSSNIVNAFSAIANLADRSDSGKLTIRVIGTAAAGYDPSWLRNAVKEPLDEADIEYQFSQH